ncbi:MAG: hypothetical protein U0Y68_15545 [Blastocatellia bacterium]
MIKLERNKQIEAAIKRAVANHNFVAMTAPGQYLVVSGKSQAEYTVKLVKGADGHAWAQCDCPAGREQMACHHIISAGWVHKAIVRMRKAA